MPASCPNCSAALTGEYCSSCGQRRIAAGDLSARRFFSDLFEEIAKLQVGRKSFRSRPARPSGGGRSSSRSRSSSTIWRMPPPSNSR